MLAQDIDELGEQLAKGLEDAMEEAAEDYSAHPLFKDSLPANIESDPTLSALSSLIGDDGLSGAAEKVMHWKTVGNDHYRESSYLKGRLQSAQEAYTEGLRVYEALEHDDPVLKSQLHINRALCRMKLQQYVEAVEDCKQAIELDPKNVKAYYHAARGSLALELLDRAKQYCDDGLVHGGSIDNSLLQTLRNKIQESIDARAQRRRKAEQAEREKLEQDISVLTRVMALRNVEYVHPIGPGVPKEFERWTPTIDIENGLITWPLIVVDEIHHVTEVFEHALETQTIKSLLEVLMTSDGSQWKDISNIWNEISVVAEAAGVTIRVEVEKPLFELVNQLKKIHRCIFLRLCHR